MTVKILVGDALTMLRGMPSESVDCVVTSPPYFALRDYEAEGQLGLEPTPEAYVAALVLIMREVRRVLRKDGTLWLNLGDSYATDPKGPRGADKSNLSGGGGYQHTSTPPGLGKWDYRKAGYKRKDLIGIPWMVAFALRADGWFLRQDIIWSKPNPMPEPVTDRCTKAHEYMFLFSKSGRYHYDVGAISEKAESPRGPGNKRPYDMPGQRPGENANLGGSIHKIGKRATRIKRSVWTVTTAAFGEAHFATFPPALIEPCILAGCREGGTVLDPFLGTGTTGLVAKRLGRNCIGIELNPKYAAMARRRIRANLGRVECALPEESAHGPLFE